MKFFKFKLFYFALFFVLVSISYSNCGDGFISNEGSDSGDSFIAGPPPFDPDQILQNSMGVLWIYPTDMVFDEDRNMIYLIDASSRFLFSLNPETGTRQVVSGPLLGNGPDWVAPAKIALDTVNDRVIVVSANPYEIFAVDLNSGDRSLVSSDSQGIGPSLNRVRAVEMDSVNQVLYVLDRDLNALVAVNLSTGDRILISESNNATQGPRFSQLDFALDGAQGFAYVPTANVGLVRINLNNGSRSLASPQGLVPGAYFDFSQPWYDSTNNRVLGVVPGTGILATDLANGNQTFISSADVSRYLFAMSYLSDASRAFVLDGLDYSVWELNLGTGESELITTANVGSGPTLKDIDKIWVHPNGERALIGIHDFSVDPIGPAIASLNLQTGDRQVISGMGQGSGPPLGNITTNFVVSPDLQKLYFGVYNPNALMEVNLLNGDRQILSSDTVGSGPPMNAILRDIAISSDGSFVYLTDDDGDKLIKIELATGDRSLVSSDTLGTGPTLTRTKSVVIAGDTLDAYVTCSEFDGTNTTESLLRINGQTGDRTLISNATISMGDMFNNSLNMRIKDENTVYLLDGPGSPSFFEVNLQNGDRRKLIALDQLTGPRYNYPWDFHAMPDGTFYFVDIIIGVVVRIDPATGQQQIIAK